MNTPEQLCDMEMIKADFRLVSYKKDEPDHCYQIRILTDGRETQFAIHERDAERFLSELEILAATMRSRVVDARNRGEN